MRLKLWQIYLLIPCYLALGIWSYYDLKEWEESGGVKSMNSLLWFFYDLGGKPAVAGLFIAGAIMLAWGTWRFLQLDKAVRRHRDASDRERTPDAGPKPAAPSRPATRKTPAPSPATRPPEHTPRLGPQPAHSLDRPNAGPALLGARPHDNDG